MRLVKNIKQYLYTQKKEILYFGEIWNMSLFPTELALYLTSNSFQKCIY